MQKISPCLWFDSQAEQAAEFYTSVFKNSEFGKVTRYDKASAGVSGKPKGSVMTVEFTLENYKFIGLNGGPGFEFNPSISFFVKCETFAEVDKLWEQLSDSGQALMPLDTYPFSKKYGWVQDKYGVSWQLILNQGEIKQKIMPSFLFVGENAGRAEKAIGYYTSVFKDAKAGSIFRYEAGQEPDKEGAIAYADFKLENQSFAAMDSAQDHNFNYNEAVSLMVMCQTQKEIDRYWERLSTIPEAEQCGWLKDKFGVSWQIVPQQLRKLLSSPDTSKAGRAMEAMLSMKKLDIAELERAYSTG